MSERGRLWRNAGVSLLPMLVAVGVVAAVAFGLEVGTTHGQTGRFALHVAHESSVYVVWPDDGPTVNRVASYSTSLGTVNGMAFLEDRFYYVQEGGSYEKTYQMNPFSEYALRSVGLGRHGEQVNGIAALGSQYYRLYDTGKIIAATKPGEVQTTKPVYVRATAATATYYRLFSHDLNLYATAGDSSSGYTLYQVTLAEYAVNNTGSASYTSIGTITEAIAKGGFASDGSTVYALSHTDPGVLYSLDLSDASTTEIGLVSYLGNASGMAWGLLPPHIARTPTPAPTITPRPQDVGARLHPHPASITYVNETTYEFTFEGTAAVFPIIVRSGNAAAVKVGADAAGDCTTGAADYEFSAISDAIYLYVCDAANVNATIQVMRKSDRGILAEYGVYIPAGLLPTPAPASASPFDRESAPKDKIGLGVFFGAVCQGMGVACQTRVFTHGFVLLGAAGLGIAPTLLARGQASAGALGLGITFFILLLFMGVLWLGYPGWVAGLAVAAVTALAGLGILAKLRSARA